MSKRDRKIRERVGMDSEKLMELWDGLYYEGTSHVIDNESYTHIDKVNTSDSSDGDSWDYIVQRKSDSKFFKFNIWDSGNNGYVFEDEYLEEVFPKTKTVYK
jgi:hypothetical protein